MFTKEVYPGSDFAVMHWDNIGAAAPESPAALELAGAYAYIDDGPFDAPDGKEVVLLPEEKAALGAMAAGMDEFAAQNRIEEWFDNPIGSVLSLQRKLGATGAWAGEATVRLAYDKELLLAERSSDLTRMSALSRQDFLGRIPLLGANRHPQEVYGVLGVDQDAFAESIEMIARDVGFYELQRPGQALMMLAGAGEVLSKYAGITDLRDYLRPLPVDNVLEVFPPKGTKSIWMTPFKDNPHISIRFSGQPLSAVKEDVFTGGVDKIRIHNAIVDVWNPIVDREGRTLLAPRELAAFVFRCTGMDVKEVGTRTTIRGNGKSEPALSGACKKILAQPNRIRSRLSEQALRAAFRKRIFTSRQRPDLSGLDATLHERLFVISEGMAQGKTIPEISSSLGYTSITTVCRNIVELTTWLEVDNAAAIMLIAEADNLKHPVELFD